MIAASAILFVEAETTQEMDGTHARNASFVTTPALFNDDDHDVSPTAIDEEIDGSGAVSSLSSHTEAHTTTLFGDYDVTVVTYTVDDVTTASSSTGADYVTVVDNITLSSSNRTTTPPSGNATTHDSVTTLHIAGTPSTSGSRTSAGTTSGSTSSVSFTQTSDNVSGSTMSPTDAMTDAYNETLDGATIQTTPVTNFDEPVATKSVDVAESEKDSRLQTHLGGALMPVYQMTSFFLERIVQTNYVTQVDRLIFAFGKYTIALFRSHFEYLN